MGSENTDKWVTCGRESEISTSCWHTQRVTVPPATKKQRDFGCRVLRSSPTHGLRQHLLSPRHDCVTHGWHINRSFRVQVGSRYSDDLELMLERQKESDSMRLVTVVEYRKTSVAIQKEMGSSYILPWNSKEQNRMERHRRRQSEVTGNNPSL